MEERAGLKIRVFGDPVLRKRAGLVKEVDSGCRNILSHMAQLMYEASGIGLAAPQVGINQAMIVVDAGSGLYKLINPKITAREGRQALEEGCLSVPGVCIKVNRAMRVVVEALDENSKAIKIDAEGLFACVLQHEIDHLKGKLIVDYASFLDKLKIKNKLSKLEKRVKDEVPKSETESCKLQL